MGRARIAFRLAKGLSHRISNLGHQRNAAGYAGKSMRYGTGAGRRALYGRNSNATGGQVEDDYEVDMTSNAISEVSSYMRGECANAGQEALVEQSLNDMKCVLVIYKDFNPGHAAQPDESPIAHIEIGTNHPEAIGQIVEGAINLFYEYAESVNTG
jgi:hypothetical protein